VNILTTNEPWPAIKFPIFPRIFAISVKFKDCSRPWKA
jgi:hypothetical protein